MIYYLGSFYTGAGDNILSPVQRDELPMAVIEVDVRHFYYFRKFNCSKHRYFQKYNF